MHTHHSIIQRTNSATDNLGGQPLSSPPPRTEENRGVGCGNDNATATQPETTPAPISGTRPPAAASELGNDATGDDEWRSRPATRSSSGSVRGWETAEPGAPPDHQVIARSPPGRAVANRLVRAQSSHAAVSPSEDNNKNPLSLMAIAPLKQRPLSVRVSASRPAVGVVSGEMAAGRAIPHAVTHAAGRSQSARCVRGCGWARHNPRDPLQASGQGAVADVETLQVEGNFHDLSMANASSHVRSLARAVAIARRQSMADRRPVPADSKGPRTNLRGPSMSQMLKRAQPSAPSVSPRRPHTSRLPSQPVTPRAGQVRSARPATAVAWGKGYNGAGAKRTRMNSATMGKRLGGRRGDQELGLEAGEAEMSEANDEHAHSLLKRLLLQQDAAKVYQC